MSSYYSVIQYSPDPLAGERINIGVLAFSDNEIKVRFSTNWGRIKAFGKPEDMEHLKEFAARMQDAVKNGLMFPGDKPNKTPRHERLAKLSRGWINSIQFTEPCGSLDTVEGLLTEVAQRCLHE